jgi:hypothetical protein
MKYANGISYKFIEEQGGWISIYEVNDGLPDKPIIQACNIERAEEYIIMRERVNVPLNRI